MTYAVIIELLHRLTNLHLIFSVVLSVVWFSLTQIRE
jgi:hypothetical protein